MDKRGVITFLDYKVNKIEFVNNNEYNGDEVDVDFDVTAQFKVSQDGQEMIVVLKTDIFAPKEEKIYPFRMTVEVEGYFGSNFDQQDDKISQYGKNAVVTKDSCSPPEKWNYSPQDPLPSFVFPQDVWTTARLRLRRFRLRPQS